MIFYLHQKLKIHLTNASPFDQLMSMRGEIYRHQKGRLTQRIQLGVRDYFIKQHHGVGFKEIIKNLLQGRLPVLSARKEWLALKKLAALGVAVPKLVGYGERGVNIAKLKSFVLMEALTSTLSLEEITNQWQFSQPSFHFKQQLILALATIARKLHQHGINHRDFYLCHFLLDATLVNKKISARELYLIDLHRAQVRKTTPTRWIIKDLAGLYFSSKSINLTRHDFYRFMKKYSGKTLRETMTSDKYFWENVKSRGEKLYRDHQP